MAGLGIGSRRRRATLAAATIGLLTLVGTACSPGAPTEPNALAGQVTTRSVDITISGATTYSVDDAPALAAGGSRGFAIAYNGSSLVTDVEGTLAYDVGATTVPTLALDLTTDAIGTSGRATVTDSSAGVSVTVNGTVTGYSVDDLGNVAGSITSGGRTVSFSTTSAAAAPGTDPALEALRAEETDFCAAAQQSLAGLDPAEVPLGDIINTREANRDDFAGSKSILTPLTTRTWTDTTDVQGSGGDLLTISQRISCKTRQADHLATTGVTTAPVDAACSTLNQRSIDLALAQMTPAQQAAVTLPLLGPDVVRQTGAEWTTPLRPDVEFSGNVLRAHALLTGWNDPAFVIFPDTIRGVHYCTVWTPAYAYSYLLDTIAP